MTIKIKQQLVSSNLAKKVTYSGDNTKEYIIIHETANTSKGANAQAHANLQSNGNSRSASWQYQCGSDGIIQSFSDDTQCWAASNEYYNKNGINIEICVNSDGDYIKAVGYAIELTKYLMKRYNIPAKNVIQHHETSGGKDCPRYLRAGNKGITWTQFKTKLTGKSDQPVSKPKANLKIDGYMGKLTVQALQRYFGTPVDGVLSKPSMVIKALQRFLGSTQDGYISEPYSNMVAALQRKFGMKYVDGKLSKPSLVIKELQRRLNKGKL